MSETKKDSGFFRRGLEMVGLMRFKVDLATLMADPDRYLRRSLETEGDVSYMDSFHPVDEFDGRADEWTLVSRFQFTEGRLPSGDPLYLGVERDTTEERRDDLTRAHRLWVRGRLLKGNVGRNGEWEIYMIGSGKYRIVS